MLADFSAVRTSELLYIRRYVKTLFCAFQNELQNIPCYDIIY